MFMLKRGTSCYEWVRWYCNNAAQFVFPRSPLNSVNSHLETSTYASLSWSLACGHSSMADPSFSFSLASAQHSRNSARRWCPVWLHAWGWWWVHRGRATRGHHCSPRLDRACNDQRCAAPREARGQRGSGTSSCCKFMREVSVSVSVSVCVCE